MVKNANFFDLLKAELKKNFVIVRRYPLNLVGSSLTFIITTIVLMFGISKMGNIVQVFGLVVFPLLLGLVGYPSGSLRHDIEIGTFEAVFNSKFSLYKIVLSRTLGNFTFSLIPSVIIFFIINIFFYNISTNLISYIIIFLLLIINGLSIGTILLGITLNYRRTASLINLINLMLLFEVLVPIIHFDELLRNIFIYIIPFGGFIAFIQNTFLENPIISEFKLGLIVFLNSLFWWVISFVVYKRFLLVSKRTGNLGLY